MEKYEINDNTYSIKNDIGNIICTSLINVGNGFLLKKLIFSFNILLLINF